MLLTSVLMPPVFHLTVQRGFCMLEGCLLIYIIARPLKVTCLYTFRKEIKMQVGYFMNSLDSKQTLLYISRVRSLGVEEIHFDSVDLVWYKQTLLDDSNLILFFLIRVQQIC